MSASPAPAEPRPATLRDVARRTGVHATTVSLALRDRPGVSPAVRARIRAAAAALGYRPAAHLHALTARRLGAPAPRPRLAFVSNHRDAAAFAVTAHMRDFLAGATAQAEAMGYTCERLLVGHRNLTPAALRRRLDATGCVGVILGAFTLPGRALGLDWSGRAVVKIDTRFCEPGVDFVAHDQFEAVRLADTRLRALGYRRIGMAVGRYDEEATEGLYSGAARLVQADRPPTERVPPLHFGLRDRMPQAVPKLRAWLRRHRVDAVIGNWANLLDLVRAAGVRVPEEVACANLCLSQPDPALAGVWLDHQAVGRRAAELVVLNHRTGRLGVSATPRSTYLAGRWRDGASAPAR